MRGKHWAFVSLGLFSIAAAAGAGGCNARINDCNLDPDCVPAVSGEGGAGGGGGGTPLSCIPFEKAKQTGGPVGDECGVFVRAAGDDSNEGTSKLNPLKTLKQAIVIAKVLKKPIYACAEVFAEAVEIPKGIEIYGGLDCSLNWLYAGETKKTEIAPGPDLIPMRFPNEGDIDAAHLEDVIARAADATIPGGSSIAAIADAVTVELVRSELIAGAGKFGHDGTTPSDSIGPTDPTDAAIAGKSGQSACMGGANGNPGGETVINAMCETSGGAGGTGKDILGENGTDGQPLPSPNPQNYGIGGTGASASNCKSGQNGALGEIGTLGLGATGDNGTIDFDGYRGVDGASGLAGRPGQGGGGGGAAKGKSNCHGASGGSGGAGGCGGKGGAGGQAGGASIALISLGATLVFDNVKLAAADGGNGGGGGLGQQGAIGGNSGMGGLGATGAMPTLPGCNGGDGGSGGTGGRGGGGRGGHSIGIAWKGVAPQEALMDTILIGNAGNGGIGDDATNAGADGLAVPTLQFD